MDLWESSSSNSRDPSELANLLRAQETLGQAFPSNYGRALATALYLAARIATVETAIKEHAYSDHESGIRPHGPLNVRQLVSVTRPSP